MLYRTCSHIIKRYFNYVQLNMDSEEEHWFQVPNFEVWFSLVSLVGYLTLVTLYFPAGLLLLSRRLIKGLLVIPH